MILRIFGSMALSLALAAGLGGQALRAQAAPSNEVQNTVSNEVLFRNGYAEIIADPEIIPTLGLKVGYKCLILLPSDERILRVEVGIRGTVMDVKKGANWVTIRPGLTKISTNLHIGTDQGRVYSFNLVEGGGPHKEPHQKVLILRPDMDLDAEGGPAVPAPSSAPVRQGGSNAAPAPAMNEPVQLGGGRSVAVIGMDDEAGGAEIHRVPGVPGAETIRKLDYDYKISNQKPKVFSINRVYNDGQRTFVVYKSTMLEAPLFYRVDPNGKREILTYRIEPSKDPRDPDVFIIPRLVDRGTVKIGDYEATFVWRKAE